MSTNGGIAENRSGFETAKELARGSTSGGGGAPFQRFVVLHVVSDPTNTQDKLSEISKKYSIAEEVLKSAPHDSVIGQPTSLVGSSFEKPMVLYPFYAHNRSPVKTGEHVWAFFEAGSQVLDYGYWVTRIVEPRMAEDPSHTHADRKHHASSGPERVADDQRNDLVTKPSFASGAEGRLGTSARSTSSLNNPYSKLRSYEDLLTSDNTIRRRSFAKVRRRPTDYVIEGSHGSHLRVGSDVGGTLEASSGKNASAIDLVAGFGTSEASRNKPNVVENALGEKEIDKRIGKESSTSGLPDYEHDTSRILIQEDGSIDARFSLNLPGNFKVSEGAAIIEKTDHVRVIARKSIAIILQENSGDSLDDCATILVKDGNIIFQPSKTGVIKLGGDDADKAILTSPGASSVGGNVVASPITDTLGASMGAGGPNGEFARKVLLK